MKKILTLSLLILFMSVPTFAISGKVDQIYNYSHRHNEYRFRLIGSSTWYYVRVEEWGYQAFDRITAQLTLALNVQKGIWINTKTEDGNQIVTEFTIYK